MAVSFQCMTKSSTNKKKRRRKKKKKKGSAELYKKKDWQGQKIYYVLECKQNIEGASFRSEIRFYPIYKLMS